MSGLTFTYSTLVMAIGQYTLEGVSAVQNGLELGNGEFQAALPTIISLAEERITRDLNTSVFDVTKEGFLTMNNPYLSIPQNYLGIRYLTVATDAVNDFTTYIPMRRKDITWVENYWRNDNATDTPEYYAVSGNNENSAYSGSFKLAPTPDVDYPYRLRYITRPETISYDNPTTWLSTYAADCLLWACLAESMAYLREDLQSEAGMTNMFENKYKTEVEKLKKELSNQIIAAPYF